MLEMSPVFELSDSINHHPDSDIAVFAVEQGDLISCQLFSEKCVSMCILSQMPVIFAQPSYVRSEEL